MKWKLPDIRNEPIAFPYFPTRQQLFIWRNWGTVEALRLAEVLNTSLENVNKLAADMGLPNQEPVQDRWMERGYITIIRDNWHVLPYDQLLQLLGWSEERLGFTLKEDDFLHVKLGDFKPDAKPVIYRGLTDDEMRRTRQIKAEAERMRLDSEAGTVFERPFSFLDDWNEPEAILPASKEQPDADELRLDDHWTVTVDRAAGTLLDVFARRFIDSLLATFGIRLTMSLEADGEGKTIALSIRSDGSLPAESHSVRIGQERIEVIGIDAPGVWRGLQYMLQAMKTRGAPILRLENVARETRMDLRLGYSYFAVYGDPLLDPLLDPYPDRLLSKLSEAGINGVWLQGILYQLVPWEEAPGRSEHWEIRLDNLRKLVERAASYGIGIYLYLNEPRAMPLAFFDDHSDWKGHELDGYACLCTSHPDIQRYVRDSCDRLMREVPDLAGVFTITMSENLTNCYSRSYPNAPTRCPRCAQRPIQDVVAEVNRCIAEGIRSVKPAARVICWTWGYTDYRGWDEEAVRRTVEAMPEGVSIMSTSEFELETEVGGVSGKLTDYSISQIGPSAKSRQFWELASARGLSAIAKVQFNNSWECAAVPYIPVVPLVERHLRRLREADVTGLMVSWTLGGYPSLLLDYASRFYWEKPGNPPEDSRTFAAEVFGARAGQRVAEAWEAFSAAFREFPLSMSMLYAGPQNAGPSNLLFLQPTGYRATMVCYPYDDLNRWRSIYPESIFFDQLHQLVAGWRKGLELLDSAEEAVEPRHFAAFQEMRRMVLATYHHFGSAWHQAEFIRLRDLWHTLPEGPDKSDCAAAMQALLKEERSMAVAHCQLMRQDSKIGFEASNHYFYTAQSLLEKGLNCAYLHQQLNKAESAPEGLR
ncbi:glycoside hydrolase family 20 zincin-like fold domain-containing protein [Paenibacillus hodogayensis]|uniref:Glycoside hydrolase family 20 zincin-like fold domain-containing protein n=1 Tax=Paenibacillus hodogayensis TaxID=279208 RepID=A0ABV5W547_9BACL